MRRVMVVVGVLMFVLSLGVLAQPAGAESTTPYVGASTAVPPTDPVATVDPGAIAAPTQVEAATVTQGGLPITGSDVAGLFGIAVVLIAAGAAVLVVRRRVDRTPAALASAS